MPPKTSSSKTHPPATLPPETVEAMFARFRAANPKPRGELDYINPYTLLVAVVLSAQATDASVNKATAALFKVAKTPAEMLALGEEGLKAHIRTIGLFNNKAKNILKLSRALVEEHGGEVPRERDALERLAGVGRKSANVVLNIAFGEPVIAVDTHIFRVANRTGLAPGKTPAAVEKGLDRVVPPRFKHDAHHWLILHGRYVCKARKPDCPNCLIADLCAYEEKTAGEDIPAAVKPSRKAAPVKSRPLGPAPRPKRAARSPRPRRGGGTAARPLRPRPSR